MNHQFDYRPVGTGPAKRWSSWAIAPRPRVAQSRFDAKIYSEHTIVPGHPLRNR